MKKVVHIMNSLLPSGAETMLKVSASEWIGYDKYIVVTWEELGAYAKELENAGYKICHVYDSNKSKQKDMLLLLIRNIAPNVVHIHCEEHFLQYAKIAKEAGVPVVIRTVHNAFRHTGRFLIKSIIYRKIAKYLGVRFVAIGKSVYDNEKRRYMNKCNYIINNWCNEEIYSPISEEFKIEYKKKYGLHRNTFTIVSVGNCNHIKNHKFVIMSLHKLVKEFKLRDDEVRYFHIGSGIEENNEKQLASRLGLMQYINFEGRKEPLGYLQLCDLFVMPSIYEGLGISGLEAAFCGIPCLFTDVAGLEDFKEITSDNIFFSELDFEKFYTKLKCIYQIYRSGHLSNSFDEAKKVHALYNMQRSVRQYMRVYEK